MRQDQEGNQNLNKSIVDHIKISTMNIMLPSQVTECLYVSLFQKQFKHMLIHTLDFVLKITK